MRSQVAFVASILAFAAVGLTASTASAQRMVVVEDGRGEGGGGDWTRFRGGIDLTGGGILLSGYTVGVVGIEGQLGVQVNNLLGFYVQPHLVFGGGQYTAAGFSSSGFDGVFGVTGLVDFTFDNRIAIAGGGGVSYTGVNNFYASPTIEGRFAFYPVENHGRGGRRRGRDRRGHSVPLLDRPGRRGDADGTHGIHRVRGVLESGVLPQTLKSAPCRGRPTVRGGRGPPLGSCGAEPPPGRCAMPSLREGRGWGGARFRRVWCSVQGRSRRQRPCTGSLGVPRGPVRDRIRRERSCTGSLGVPRGPVRDRIRRERSCTGSLRIPRGPVRDRIRRERSCTGSLRIPRGPVRDRIRRERSCTGSLRIPRGPVRDRIRRERSCTASLRVPRGPVQDRIRRERSCTGSLGVPRGPVQDPSAGNGSDGSLRIPRGPVQDRCPADTALYGLSGHSQRHSCRSPVHSTRNDTGSPKLLRPCFVTERSPNS